MRQVVERDEVRNKTPSRRSWRKISAAAIVTTSVVSVLLSSAALPAAAYQATTKCDAAIIVIGARGTNEPPGLGSTASIVTSLAEGDNEIPTWSLSVDYPAAAFEVGESYFTSVATGVTNLQELIFQTVEECPSSNIALVGYSQGADVIGDVLEQGLPENLRSRILSVVFFGDPTYRAGEPYNAAGSGAGDGAFPRAAGALSDWTRLGYPTPDTVTPVPVPIVKSYCFTGDRWCQKGLGQDAVAIHESYKNTVTVEAWNFLRGFVFDSSRRATSTR